MTKTSTLTEIIQVLEKPTFFFKKSKLWAFWEILLFVTHSTDLKKIELRTGHWAFKSDIVKWQNVQKRSISAFWVDEFLSIFKCGRKMIKVWASPKIVMGITSTLVLQCLKPKTFWKVVVLQTHNGRDKSETPNSVKHMKHSYGWLQNYTAKKSVGQSDNVQNPKLWNFQTEIKMTQPKEPLHH